MVGASSGGEPAGMELIVTGLSGSGRAGAWPGRLRHHLDLLRQLSAGSSPGRREPHRRVGAPMAIGPEAQSGKGESSAMPILDQMAPSKVTIPRREGQAWCRTESSEAWRHQQEGPLLRTVEGATRHRGRRAAVPVSGGVRG